MNPEITVASAQNPISERILVVDVLRGFALLGILIAHITFWFDGGGLPGHVYDQAFGKATPLNQVLNGIVSTFLNIFVSGKFFTFFSFLFGLSFALQMASLEKKETHFMFRYAWRIVLLGVIGFVHTIHWQGDILTIYTILGFILLFFHKVPDKIVLIVAILLVLNVPGRVQDVYYEYIAKPVPVQIEKENKFNEVEVEKGYQAMMTGTYAENLQANLKAFRRKMNFQFGSGRIYITLGFFLLGLYAGRKKIFENFPENKPQVKRFFKIIGFVNLGWFVAGLSLILILQSLYGNQQPPFGIQVLGNVIFDTFSTLLTIFYITGITLLFANMGWQKRLSVLAPVGKMALTSYVSQSLFGILLFYGYAGLGLTGKLAPWICFLLTFPVYFLQLLFSRWWLSKFRYGPLEWLWRSGTYLKWQPLLKS